MTTVAAVIFSLDGAQNLTECLRSVRWADRILVLHAGDEPSLLDAGLDPAPTVRRWTIGDTPKEWRNEIETDWVLHLWDDERVDARLGEQLTAFRHKSHSDIADQYAIQIRSLLLGGWIEGSLRGPQPAPRLRRRPGSILGGWGPEEAASGSVTNLMQGWIEDYGAVRLADGIERVRQVSDLWCKDSLVNGRALSSSFMWRSPVSLFLRLLFSKRLLFDGFPGLTFATLAAYGALLHGAKVWEARAGKRDSGTRRTGSSA